jgi:hypothetical protein
VSLQGIQLRIVLEHIGRIEVELTRVKTAKQAGQTSPLVLNFEKNISENIDRVRMSTYSPDSACSFDVR